MIAWLESALSDPYRAAFAALLFSVVAVGALHAFNPPGSKPARKGWHPFTIVCIAVFAAVGALALLIEYGVLLSPQ